MTERPHPPRGPFRQSKRQIVRLACLCGRNLADIRLTLGEPPGELRDDDGCEVWPEERVFCFPRPGVRHAEHPRDGGGYTFRWDCRCGRTWQFRDDRIKAIWQEHAAIGQITRLMLGFDV
jgi:hypothetical protein